MLRRRDQLMHSHEDIHSTDWFTNEIYANLMCHREVYGSKIHKGRHDRQWHTVGCCGHPIPRISCTNWRSSLLSSSAKLRKSGQSCRPRNSSFSPPHEEFAMGSIWETSCNHAGWFREEKSDQMMMISLPDSPEVRGDGNPKNMIFLGSIKAWLNLFRPRRNPPRVSRPSRSYNKEKRMSLPREPDKKSCSSLGSMTTAEQFMSVWLLFRKRTYITLFTFRTGHKSLTVLEHSWHTSRR